RSAPPTAYTFLPPAPLPCSRSFFFTATPTPEIYTLSLHDALPISDPLGQLLPRRAGVRVEAPVETAGDEDAVLEGRPVLGRRLRDRKSTRLNSSHGSISYAVFCLKKKRKRNTRKSWYIREH